MGLNATLITVVANTIAHASDANTNWGNLNAVNAIYNGSDLTSAVGHNLTGSSDSGVYTATHVATVGSGVEVILKVNSYNDGANDRFINSSTGALELRISATGIAARVSTNTHTAAATVTWGSDTFLYGS